MNLKRSTDLVVRPEGGPQENPHRGLRGEELDPRRIFSRLFENRAVCGSTTQGKRDGQTMSAPLDRGCTVPLCAVCIEAGRATEATYQTRDWLCGCDQHIQQLEQHGRAAVRRRRSAAADRGASPARGTTVDRPAGSRDQGAGLGDGSAGPSDHRAGGRPRLSDGHGGMKRSRQPTSWTAGQAKPR